ncbi:Cation/H(+) antiporter 18 [Sesamum alatum]|uniref:Cation/H(+) antiporter 18 n=1 Tax=Sesamum alatum TaxID=300844 RepID=A0AAE1Y3J6_9LAMI|nr:Cation/H(+) antiporter 18 [Sesamum alatum]
MAMSEAAVNNVATWILLALAIALSGTGDSAIVSLWVFLYGFGFMVLCIFVCPIIFKWIARQCPRGEPLDEIYICATLVAIFAAGFITDIIGIDAHFGALFSPFLSLRREHLLTLLWSLPFFPPFR